MALDLQKDLFEVAGQPARTERITAGLFLDGAGSGEQGGQVAAQRLVEAVEDELDDLRRRALAPRGFASVVRKPGGMAWCGVHAGSYSKLSAINIDDR